MNKLKNFIRNFGSAHHRIMARYLEKRGWVVFYLEEQARVCNSECYLKLYENIRKKPEFYLDETEVLETEDV